ncbi:MAG: type II toxin-antitoxin system RatA family toxin [Parvibaculaceae bacterium]|nr:type II toxin-antitoxin system RatA family toxin [Parvibaculaceae bacterium]
MATIRQTKDVPHGAEQMFALVAGVEQYPEFLPWCAGLRVRKREQGPEGEIITADLIAAYKMFREQFTSRVSLNQAALKIDVSYIDGPFKHLENEWRFEPLPEGGSRIHFYIDFAFKNRLLQGMIDALFSRVFERMVQAFVDRADEVYGVGGEAAVISS